MAFDFKLNRIAVNWFILNTFYHKTLFYAVRFTMLAFDRNFKLNPPVTKTFIFLIYTIIKNYKSLLLENV